LEKKVKLAVEVLTYSLYQDFPFDAAIALFWWPMPYIRGLKDQIITKLFRLYGQDTFSCAYLF